MWYRAQWKLYAQRLQKLIYLHLSTDYFMKISLQLTGPRLKGRKRDHRLKSNLHETVCRQGHLSNVMGPWANQHAGALMATINRNKK